MSLGKSFFHARKYLKKQKADLVVGFGGYPSVPPIMAAKSLGIPTLLHEQNAFMGKANRLLAKFSDRIALPFETRFVKGLTEATKAKSFVSGNPVRQTFLTLAPKVLDEHGRLTLLVLGGSLGAKVMSDEVPKAIAQLSTSEQKQLVVLQIDLLI